MSLSLSRRIARAALLVAAGAAPLVGATGSASAVELPKATDVGGLAKLDGAGVGHGVHKTANKAAPATKKTTGKVARQASKAVGRTEGSAAGLVKETAGTLKRTGLSVGKAAGPAARPKHRALSADDALPGAGTLPAKTDALPRTDSPPTTRLAPASDDLPVGYVAGTKPLPTRGLLG